MDARAPGLPPGIKGALFDLDGVLTRTTKVHEAAWKDTFEAVLALHGDRTPFTHRDYVLHVDGRRREDGVRDFLASRGIALPEGTPQDPPGDGTVWGVGNRKNVQLLEHLRTDGVDVYDGSVRYLQACRERGIRRAVVSSSANTHAVLAAAGLQELVELEVDGQRAAELNLAGKPAPDTYLQAAAELGLPASECAVFEDALVGVAAGRAGAFGVVVGVDRTGVADQLRAQGADLVVHDLEELL